MSMKNTKRKLLIVGSFAFLRDDLESRPIFGGLETATKILFESDLSKDFEIIPLDSSGVSPPPRVMVRAYHAIGRILTFIKVLRRDRPDAILILAIGFRLSALEKGIMTWYSSLLNIPALIFPRAGGLMETLPKSLIYFKVIRFLFSKAAVFLCQGPKWEQYAINEFKFDRKKIKIINNWTATEELLSIGKTREYNSFESPYKLLFVGWLDEEKGIFELLQACNNLIKDDININLTIAGDGSATKPLKEFIKQNNLSNHINVLGWVRRDRLERLYRESHIFSLPSYSEGLPNTMIEAMSTGLPSVVTSVGLIPGIIENNKHALIVPPRDIDSLEIALRKLIDDHRYRRNIAINGHKHSLKNFSTKTSMHQLSKSINEIIF